MHRTPRHDARTAARVFGGDAVIISPSENTVRMLNPVGTRIWELSDGTRTLEAIAEALTGEFDVDLAEAQRSVVSFVDELVGKRLLVLEG